MLRGRAGLEVKETISFLDLLSLRCHQETEICEFPTTGAMEDIDGLQEQKGRIIFIENSVQFSHSVVSSPITSWQIDGETMKTVTDLFFWAPKSLQMVTAAMKLKDACSLEEKL